MDGFVVEADGSWHIVKMFDVVLKKQVMIFACLQVRPFADAGIHKVQPLCAYTTCDVCLRFACA